jgi:uncharacterized protein (DUF58 family)
MIVPGNRLLFWVAALLPFAALAGPVPEAAGLAAALYGALLAAAAADAALALARCRRFALALPPVVRMAMGRKGAIPVLIRRAGGVGAGALRVGLPLPPAIRSERDALAVSLPQGAEASAVDWPCTPGARGSYAVDRCCFEVDSPLGLWSARGISECRSEVRVYPALDAERRALAAYFLRRGNFGLRTQRTVGQGRDFERLREYMPGDSYDDIHWKATAKRGRPVTRLYQVERTQEVYVLVDCSRLSGRPVGGEPALERFIAAALVLGLAAERQGDRFGLVVFGGRVRRFLRAGRGKRHYHACRDALYTLAPETGSPDFGELFSFVRLRLRRRSLLVLLTDLGDPLLAEGFLRHAELACRQHVALVCMLRQPGVEPLFCGPDAADAGAVCQRLGGHLAWRKLKALEKELGLRGVRLSVLDDARLSAETVAQYMNVKARQML